MDELHRRLRALSPPMLRGIRRGIEKEGLRVDADGRLSSAPHPEGLGAALTHPRITTDFSEAQLELITGVHTDIDGCLRELTELHQVVYRSLGNELLWCTSLPCKLPPDDRIPIARYGSSNAGRLKEVYRMGLAHRYGRRMQVISGVHYNFSLPEALWEALREVDGERVAARTFRDQRYLALIRNFRRHAWLLLLLLGASPAACGSFVQGRNHGLSTWDTGSVFAPFATSLRMGRLGYQSDAQASLAVSFNDLAGYANALGRALRQPYPPYESIGLRDDGEYRQLSTSLLQLENEFYGTIRPKRVTRPGERPLRALNERGIEYVEVRCLDLDPYSAIGIEADTIRLLDVFLLHCLLLESPPDSARETEAVSAHQRLVAEAGRDPSVRLNRAGTQVTPAEWGAELLRQCEPIAAALDEAHAGTDYARVLEVAARALAAPSSLPSSRVLRETEEKHRRSFPDFAMALTSSHREKLAASPLAPGAQARYAAQAARSIADREAIEASDDEPFEAFRRRYLDQDLLGGRHFQANDV
jgi:glutamate--cysteine ligase